VDLLNTLCFGWVNHAASACYGYDESEFPEPGPLIAAASSDLYDSGAACGAFYEITCTGAASGGSYPCTSNPTVTVKVVDLCPGCNANSFDLSQQAFAMIANLAAGRLTITAQQYFLLFYPCFKRPSFAYATLDHQESPKSGCGRLKHCHDSH